MCRQTRGFFRIGTALLITAGIFCSCCTATFGQQNEPPVRVAIVGLEHGHVAGFLNAFPKQQDAQLVGIVDADQALCAKYEQQYHLSPSMFYATLDDLLAHQHPQALLVYTAVGEHRRVIEAGAAHGLDVMVEKPLTLSLDDALAIRRAADEHHVQVLVNYETTWYASNRAVYDMIQQGKLGDVRRVVIHDGHQGPIEIHVQPEFLKWLTRSGGERRWRALRFRLLWRGPDDVADARRGAVERDGCVANGQAGASIRASMTMRRSFCATRRLRPY